MWGGERVIGSRCILWNKGLTTKTGGGENGLHGNRSTVILNEIMNCLERGLFWSPGIPPLLLLKQSKCKVGFDCSDFVCIRPVLLS
ncbi:unnamed protein product [Litomosoides sigmodontis]|uniref:Uncharacterized protein n=1 Tax=Litomosoides sigmodontis TaxID=42156 RepID=A0A3P6TKQ7_LITSI|nr:unnamed protein product [Litomosoides sigmodontis]